MRIVTLLSLFFYLKLAVSAETQLDAVYKINSGKAHVGYSFQKLDWFSKENQYKFAVYSYSNFGGSEFEIFEVIVVKSDFTPIAFTRKVVSAISGGTVSGQIKDGKIIFKGTEGPKKIDEAIKLEPNVTFSPLNGYLLKNKLGSRNFKFNSIRTIDFKMDRAMATVVPLGKPHKGIDLYYAMINSQNALIKSYITKSGDMVYSQILPIGLEFTMEEKLENAVGKFKYDKASISKFFGKVPTGNKTPFTK